jgi:hypothetical protein
MLVHELEEVLSELSCVAHNSCTPAAPMLIIRIELCCDFQPGLIFATVVFSLFSFEEYIGKT